jgi:hypothetical protein
MFDKTTAGMDTQGFDIYTPVDRDLLCTTDDVESTSLVDGDEDGWLVLVLDLKSLRIKRVHVSRLKVGDLILEPPCELIGKPEARQAAYLQEVTHAPEHLKPGWNLKVNLLRGPWSDDQLGKKEQANV